MAKNETIDHELIRKLAELLSETDLTEIEVEHETLRLRLSRNSTAVATVAAPAPVQVAAPAVATAAPATQQAAPSPAATDATNQNAQTSPMVGTAYLAPEPGQPNFVSVGDSVKAGQTVLIIEAMKTMNHIPAPRAGTIKRILVEDGGPVEFGAPLMIIE